MLYLYCCLYRFWVCFDFEFGFPFCQQHPRNLGLCHFEGPGIFRVACFPAQVTYICRCGCVLMLVCCGVFMLAMKAFIFCVYSMANKCANARAIKKKIQKSPIWEAGTLRFSNANLFRPKKLHSYPIRIFNRIAFN